MPEWLYRHFLDAIGPLIFTKNGRSLTAPPSFIEIRPYLPASLWIHPPEPVMSLHHHKFEPELLYRPRIFLWLPHFFVKTMHCLNCRTGVLEKNGASPPRRITDMDDCFWIIRWKYYCRSGCQSHFREWHPSLIGSLPPYLQLAFPAVLSRKGGLSHRVISQLRVGNQHKMGPSGVRALLLEMHTKNFNTRQLQYLEAVYELTRGYQESESYSTSQTTLHAFINKSVLSFGDFGDPQKYGGYVPSESYLAAMMNLIIERNEADANQHTSCLRPDQICIDDSHKVCLQLLLNRIFSHITDR